MNSAISRALNRIQHDGRFTMQEMAEVAGCSPRHLYNCADTNHNAEMRADALCDLSRYLSQHGETRLATALLDPRWKVTERVEGMSDGRTDEEMADAVRAAVGADQAHKQRDCEAMLDCIRALNKAAADLEAEYVTICD